MSWSVITSAEVLQEFNPKEQLAIAGIQGAADNLSPILQRVVNAARGCIIAGGGQVDQAGTIPDQLREDVIAIARWRWIISIPDSSQGESLQNKNRKGAYDDAMKRMDDIAAAKIKIELPTAPIVQASPDNAIEVASSQPRRFTRDQMEGM